MKIEKNQNGSGYVLTNEAGATLSVSFAEFWEICRVGTFIDTKSEVEEYLSQCPEINGHDLDRIRAFPELVEKITEQVIQDRVSDENGEQIYYAAVNCINSHIAATETQVKWFRLSEDKCISVWYAPDKHDGDQFQMHLEEIGEDGLMGPKCEVLSDESYATADISFTALCETLSEICDDAGIDDEDMVDYFGDVSGVAKEIFRMFEMNFERRVENTEIINEDDLRLFISDYRGENYLNLSEGDLAQISEDNDCFKHIYESVKESLEDEGITFDDVDISHYSPDENRFVLLDIVSNSFKEYKQCPDLYKHNMKTPLDAVIDEASAKVDKPVVNVKDKAQER